jgi:hypothetical protein
MERVIIPDETSISLYADAYAYQFTEKEFDIIFPLIVPVIDRKLAALSRKIDYYEGLKETCATAKQLDKLLEYQEKYDMFMSIKRSVKVDRRPLVNPYKIDVR